MKTKILAAIAFAVIVTIMSCKWFSHKKDNANKTNLLAGRYELIDVADSATDKKWKQDDTLKWFFNSPLKDTSQRYLNFAKDSLVTYETATEVDSSKYYADTANKIVYIKEDSLYQPYKIIQQSDSIVNLFAANDSVYFALRKL
jgi:hypothetical protein